MSWREIAAPIIAEVIQETGRDDMKKLRRALREAYPFGERAYHPYKVWCSEVKYQLYGRPKKPIKTIRCTQTIDLFKD